MTLIVAAIILMFGPGSPLSQPRTDVLGPLLHFYETVSHQLRAGTRIVAGGYGDEISIANARTRILGGLRRGLKMVEPLVATIEALKLETDQVEAQRRHLRACWWRSTVVWMTCAIGVCGITWAIPAPDLKELGKGMGSGTGPDTWLGATLNCILGLVGGVGLAAPAFVRSLDSGSWWVKGSVLVGAARDWMDCIVADQPVGCFAHDLTYSSLWQIQWRDGVSTRKCRLGYLRDFAMQRRLETVKKRDSINLITPFIELIAWGVAVLCLLGPSIAAILTPEGSAP